MALSRFFPTHFWIHLYHVTALGSAFCLPTIGFPKNDFFLATNSIVTVETKSISQWFLGIVSGSDLLSKFSVSSHLVTRLYVPCTWIYSNTNFSHVMNLALLNESWFGDQRSPNKPSYEYPTHFWKSVNRVHEVSRMQKSTFLKWCVWLDTNTNLKSSRHISVQAKVFIFGPSITWLQADE